MTDDQPDTSLLSRRRLLRAMGVSTAYRPLVSLPQVQLPQAAKKSSMQGTVRKKNWRNSRRLDKRSKLILRLILVLTGLDLFLAI